MYIDENAPGTNEQSAISWLLILTIGCNYLRESSRKVFRAGNYVVIDVSENVLIKFKYICELYRPGAIGIEGDRIVDTTTYLVKKDIVEMEPHQYWQTVMNEHFSVQYYHHLFIFKNSYAS